MRSLTGYYPPRNPTFTACEGFIITQLHSRMLGFGVGNIRLGIDSTTPQPNLRLPKKPFQKDVYDAYLSRQI
jgi:hypothetical protein